MLRGKIINVEDINRTVSDIKKSYDRLIDILSIQNRVNKFVEHREEVNDLWQDISASRGYDYFSEFYEINWEINLYYGKFNYTLLKANEEVYNHNIGFFVFLSEIAYFKIDYRRTNKTPGAEDVLNKMYNLTQTIKGYAQALTLLNLCDKSCSDDFKTVFDCLSEVLTESKKDDILNVLDKLPFESIVIFRYLPYYSKRKATQEVFYAIYEHIEPRFTKQIDELKKINCDFMLAKTSNLFAEPFDWKKALALVKSGANPNAFVKVKKQSFHLTHQETKIRLTDVFMISWIRGQELDINILEEFLIFGLDARFHSSVFMSPLEMLEKDGKSNYKNLLLNYFSEEPNVAEDKNNAIKTNRSPSYYC